MAIQTPEIQAVPKLKEAPAGPTSGIDFPAKRSRIPEALRASWRDRQEELRGEAPLAPGKQWPLLQRLQQNLGRLLIGGAIVTAVAGLSAPVLAEKVAPSEQQTTLNPDGTLNYAYLLDTNPKPMFWWWGIPIPKIGGGSEPEEINSPRAGDSTRWQKIVLVTPGDRVFATPPGPGAGYQVEMYPSGSGEFKVAEDTLIVAEVTVDGTKGGFFLGDLKRALKEKRRVVIGKESGRWSLGFYDGENDSTDFTFKKPVSGIKQLATESSADPNTVQFAVEVSKDTKVISIVGSDGAQSELVELENPLLDSNQRILQYGVYSGARTTTRLDKLVQLKPRGH
ncbi:hypothetical protein HYS97_01630 [Candidatus Daviesbacteria bacterium]|nr:hypothetical protein [Candidatus Daviesbacteria bacterium]